MHFGIPDHTAAADSKIWLHYLRGFAEAVCYLVRPPRLAGFWDNLTRRFGAWLATNVSVRKQFRRPGEKLDEPGKSVIT